jgi:hypothetical protein
MIIAIVFSQDCFKVTTQQYMEKVIFEYIKCQINEWNYCDSHYTLILYN